MVWQIGEKCIRCGTCEGVCPAGAISRGEVRYEINEFFCLQCGSCAGACPVSAIVRAEKDDE